MDELYVLPEDIRILPIRELSEAAGQFLARQRDDFVITRDANTFPTRIIDAESASLLEQFRSPNTMVEAVLRHSRTRQRNPEEILNKALTLLQRLRTADLLVPVQPGQSGRTDHPDRGTNIAGYTVIEAIGRGRRTVYHVQDERSCEWALKLAAYKGGNPFLLEATVLERLAGSSVPGLGEIGIHDGYQYLVEEWCPGQRLFDMLSTDRSHSGIDQTAAKPVLGAFERIDIAYRILRAYVSIHQYGVLHGEVHAKNVIVSGSGAIKLIDFSHAVYPIGSQQVPKGTQDLAFYDPAFVLMSLNAGGEHPMTFLDEQYAVAALVFFILAGTLYNPERHSLGVQPEGHLDLVNGGLFSPLNVSRLLSRALSPVPEERYPSLEEFAREIMGLGVRR